MSSVLYPPSPVGADALSYRTAMWAGQSQRNQGRVMARNKIDETSEDR